MIDPRQQFPFSLSDTKDVATISLGEKSIQLSARELEIVALYLGHIRSLMSPPVPHSIEQAERVIPLARMEAIPIGGRPPVEIGCRVILRSTEFGWFQFLARARR